MERGRTNVGASEGNIRAAGAAKAVAGELLVDLPREEEVRSTEEKKRKKERRERELATGGVGSCEGVRAQTQ